MAAYETQLLAEFTKPQAVLLLEFQAQMATTEPLYFSKPTG